MVPLRRLEFKDLQLDNINTIELRTSYFKVYEYMWVISSWALHTILVSAEQQLDSDGAESTLPPALTQILLAVVQLAFKTPSRPKHASKILAAIILN
jgi:hypothetical protein